MLKLVSSDDPVLLRVATPVRKVGKGIREIVNNMFSVMYDSDGIGLAAPQVGLPIRVITIDIGEGNPFVLINPRIVNKSKSTKINVEGCLSFPGKYYAVERSTHITVKAKDLMNREFSFSAEGLTAICIQHENDHLDGITFDKIGKLLEV